MSQIPPNPLPPAEYAALLEEKNRILKRLQEKKKAEKEKDRGHHSHSSSSSSSHSSSSNNQTQREEGFALHFSGANTERVQDMRRREALAHQQQIRQQQSGASTGAGGAVEGSNSAPTSHRKSWKKEVTIADKITSAPPPHLRGGGTSSSSSSTANDASSSSSPFSSSAAATAASSDSSASSQTTSGSSSPTRTIASHLSTEALQQQFDAISLQLAAGTTTNPTPAQPSLALSSTLQHPNPSSATSSSSSLPLHDPISSLSPAPSPKHSGFSATQPLQLRARKQWKRDIDIAILPKGPDEVGRGGTLNEESSEDDEGYTDDFEAVEETERKTAADAASSDQGIVDESQPLSPSSSYEVSVRKTDVHLLRESLEFLNPHVPKLKKLQKQQHQQLASSRGQLPSKSRMMGTSVGASTAFDELYDYSNEDSEQTSTATASSSSQPKASASRSSQTSSEVPSPPPVKTAIIVSPPASSVSPSRPLLPSPSSASSKASLARPSTPSSTDQIVLRTSLVLSQSFDKSAVESLLLRFRKLNRKKRDKLMVVLSQLEQGDVDGIDDDLKESVELLKKSKKHGAEKEESQEWKEEKVESVSSSTTSPTSSVTKVVTGISTTSPASPSSSSSISSSSAFAPRGDDTVTARFSAPKAPLSIRILSNHGHAHSIGLTAIQVFNQAGERISVPPSAIQINYSNGRQ